MEYPILEALHQAHLLLQLGKSFVSGHNQERLRLNRRHGHQLLQRLRVDGQLASVDIFLRLEFGYGSKNPLDRPAVIRTSGRGGYVKGHDPEVSKAATGRSCFHDMTSYVYMTLWPDQRSHGKVERSIPARPGTVFTLRIQLDCKHSCYLSHGTFFFVRFAIGTFFFQGCVAKILVPKNFGEALALRSVSIATREAQNCGKLVRFAVCLGTCFPQLGP